MVTRQPSACARAYKSESTSKPTKGHVFPVKNLIGPSVSATCNNWTAKEPRLLQLNVHTMRMPRLIGVLAVRTDQFACFVVLRLMYVHVWLRYRWNIILTKMGRITMQHVYFLLFYFVREGHPAFCVFHFRAEDGVQKGTA